MRESNLVTPRLSAAACAATGRARPQINVGQRYNLRSASAFGGSVGPTLFLHPNLANQETETPADRRRRQIYREVLSPSFQLRPRGLTLGPPAKERISRQDRL